MSVFFASGSTELKQAYYGSNSLKEIWVGHNKVWPVGPLSDARLRMNFDDPASPYRNLGTEGVGVVSSGGLLHEHDNLFVSNTGRLRANSSDTWSNGFTLSMWTKDTPANSGWRTVFHRAPATGSFTTESYLVHNTNATATTIHAGLRLNGTVKEFASTATIPVGSGWTHTMVVWTRTSTTAFSCVIYINGAQRGSFSATGYPANIQFTTHPMFFGAGRDNDGFEWVGSIDDIVVWDRPLDAASVASVYALGRSWVPQITSPPVLELVVGEPGSLYLYADFPATMWTATGLPPGITLASDGKLSGTPTTAGSGTMVVTATNGTFTVTKEISWSAIVVPNSPNWVIQANGANKTSHSGWNRPSLTWTGTFVETGYFETNGTLITKQSRGRMTGGVSLVNTRASRIVSNVRGVVATASAGTTNFGTPNLVFLQGERFHLEINNYSGSANDRLTLGISTPN